jgi:hypothetical protein
MTACGGGGSTTPPPPTTYLLTVNSTNPASGVPIDVAPADNNGAINGTTSFTRTYNAGTSVTLTAPAKPGAYAFVSWTGCATTSGENCNVTMNTNTTVTANYAVPVTYVLTVNSTNPASGVTIGAAPADNNGTTIGTTSFTLTYNAGTSVTLTAPTMSGSNTFVSWTGCATTNGENCNVTMNANTTVTANYPLYLQWMLNDNAATTMVVGNVLSGTLVGGNTSAVATTLNGQGAFRLNNGTSGQYVQVALGQVQPYEVANLWTKYSGNPVITSPFPVFQGGVLAWNASGNNWYSFGGTGNGSACNAIRLQSTDLINWTNQTTVLTAGTTGAWDQCIQYSTAFYDPIGRQWVMFYRGYNPYTYQLGIALSPDGTTFTKGGTAGLYGQLGANYDLMGVILVGTRYYVYVNGSGDHGVLNVYYTDNDFATMTPYSGNPVMASGTFCPAVWAFNGNYYMLVARDMDLRTATTPYAHGLALYRSPTPTFDLGTRQYLGYAAVNDQSYDIEYLDAPTVPMTSVYQTTYGPQFGSTFNVLYESSTNTSCCITESLMSTPLSSLASLPVLNESPTMYYGGNSYSTCSFWVQFDSLSDGEPIFSVGVSPTNSTPAILANVQTSGANKVLSMFLNGTKNTSQILVTNTPYHIVLVNNGSASHVVYVNGVVVGTITQNNGDLDSTFLYIGEGAGSQFLHGYVQDFRMFPRSLTAAEITALYAGGPDGVLAAPL